MNHAADAISAPEALEIATRGGAAPLVRDDCGQIAPGMRADIAIWDISGIECAGGWDPAPTLEAGLTKLRGCLWKADGWFRTAS